jgi:CBS domain-containing protein
MTTANAGARFMHAFNEIEDHVRATLGAQEHEAFANLAPKYADKKRLPRQQRDALSAFTSLRNAISHGRYYNGRPIAEPVEDVVLQIERLRDQIKSPPRALAGHPVTAACATSSVDRISAVLAIVREHGYSQLPVYDDGHYVGLLTTNAIACWLASEFEDRGLGLAEDKTVADVLPFVEPHEVALHVPRDITAAEAIDRLSHGGPEGRPATALIVTHGGKRSEKPLAVLVSEDLPRLARSLTLN